MSGPIARTLQVELIAIGCMACLIGLSTNVAAEDVPTAAAASFERVTAPLLARHCLECHNTTDKKGGLDLSRAEGLTVGGDSGAVVTPGKPDASLLWDRIDADEMPPKHPLPFADRAALKSWITAGAKWGGGPIDRFKFTSETRAGYDWWSLQPVRRPDVPPSTDDAWSRSEVDRLVAAQRRERGLTHSSKADRRTLIRRVSFDLIGLPPKPEDVDAFINDPSPDAYEKLVDRLLASPQYGVRWARHWLDVIRFGESDGFEYDQFRANAWPYRDWVVNALNDDLPFDEFARWQIAGDVLRPGELDPAIATGYLAAGAYDVAGQKQQSAAMRAVVIGDAMEDLVGSVSQTFLGLTVNCARCHDHKFDPIRQREYYSLASALAGVPGHADRDVAGLACSEERAKRLAEMTHRRETALAKIAAIEEPVRRKILTERSAQGVKAEPIAQWNFADGLKDEISGAEVILHGSALLDREGLVLDGVTAFATAAPLAHDLRTKTLEVWVRLANLNQRGGSPISVQSVDGAFFDAIVFGEHEPKQWLAGSNNFARTQTFHAAEESVIDRVQIAITYAEDGTITAYRNGQLYGSPYRRGEVASFAAGQSQVIFGLRHSPEGPGKMLAGTIERARLYDRALTAEEVAASSGVYITPTAVRERLEPAQKEQLRLALAEIAEIDRQLSIVHPTRIHTVKLEQPAPTHVLSRGNPVQPLELVAPGGVNAVTSVKSAFDLAPDAPEAERRRRLAEWITARNNPLFARVIVNRLWHYHFGVGLVDTPNDFGFNGGRPSNQRLLDWLASELIANGYHLKPIQRLIVNSAAYRQASKSSPEAMAIDADNRLLWRKSPSRLEAEAIRDAMLATAGVLDTRLGGPSFQEMKVSIAPGTETYMYTTDDPTRDDFKRRTLYRLWARSGRSPLLDVLDCPDPSAAAPKRAVTTTPLQALALLNNAFVLHVADKFCQRVAHDAGSNPAAQVRRAYRLAYGREPNRDEASAAERVVTEHGLPVLARAIFNSNEFVYVD